MRTVLAILQRGKLAAQAVLLAASMAEASPRSRLVFAEPEPGGAWDRDVRAPGRIHRTLARYGAEVIPFRATVFGAAYPAGNKIEALAALGPEPFLFLDTDTLVLGDLAHVPFDASAPSASLRRAGTWPKPDLYGPGYAEIWQSLYDRFGLDYAASLDPTGYEDHWARHLYFNSGWFYGPDAAAFGTLYTQIAGEIWRDPPAELDGQVLDPWLDQIALPLVILALGGVRDALPPGLMDGAVTCHWRRLPLLYAREGDAVVATLERLAAEAPVKAALRDWEAARKLIYQGKGRALRTEIGPLPRSEALLRRRIKRLGYWWD